MQLDVTVMKMLKAGKQKDIGSRNHNKNSNPGVYCTFWGSE